MSTEFLSKWRWHALGLGALGLIASIPGIISNVSQSYQSYLMSYLFWSELALGSMGMLMVYHLSGGGWGTLTRRILEASTRTMLVTSLLFIPILTGLGKLFPWVDPARALSDPNLAHKHGYLNPATFTLRAVFYFVSWTWIAHLLDRWSHGQEKGSSLELQAKLKNLSAGGLVFLGFTVSFASVDWQMSLEPHWYSTVYGMVFGIGQGLGAWALTLLVFGLLARHFKELRFEPKTLRDNGNILLTLVILWAYLSFVQYLIIWSGNIPEEVVWFNHRIDGGWKWVGLLLILFQFAGPFLALLFRAVKSRPEVMLWVCAGILVIRVIDRFWFVMPAFRHGVHVAWTDFSLWVAVGGIWIWSFLTELGRKPAFATEDPAWPEAQEARAHA